MSSKEQRPKRPAAALQGPTPDGRGSGGWAVTFHKGLWDHRARTLDLSLDEAERHEGAPLLPCLGHVCSWPFYKMATTSLSSGSKHTAGLLKSSQTRAGHLLREAAVTLLQLRRCVAGGGGGGCQYAYPALALAAASVTFRVKQKG